MESTISSLVKNRLDINSYLPVFFRLNKDAERKNLQELIQSNQEIVVVDEIIPQLKELLKCLNPQRKIQAAEYPMLIQEHLGKTNQDEYGVWVFYPWNNRLVHLLDEEEFVQLRTNRNQYKITKDEQEVLRRKKIGIIGLSVGQSIALTLAMERACGELRLADFDTAELSNLNRIRTSVQNLGLSKTIIAAREIAELDPYLKVKIFSEGITESNIDSFFEEDGKLDLLVEVCDGLDVKIKSRFKAKTLKIPVVMDTNDRGMLDIERFDLEPERAILHGLAEGLDPNNIGDLTNEQKIPYILKMVGAETISTRLKASMMEVEQSINSWPQLASSVVLGGAVTTDVCRRILLDQFHDSGRYYVDLDEIIADNLEEPEPPTLKNPYEPLTIETMNLLATSALQNDAEKTMSISDELLEKIMDAAIIAPSAGNNQPWKWLFKNNRLFLFHDQFRSWSWGDFAAMGAHMSLGAAIENVRLQAATFNLETHIALAPIGNNEQLVAQIHFSSLATPIEKDLELATALFSRYTNRNNGTKQPIPPHLIRGMEELVSSYEGLQFLHIETYQQISELGDIIAGCDRVRLLHQQGHEEFYNEVRWNKEQAEATGDGIEIASVDLKASEIVGFSMAKDWKAVSLLAQKNMGNAFKSFSKQAVQTASCMALITIPAFHQHELIKAGRAVEDIWVYACKEGIAFHPMLSPVFFFNRMIHGRGAQINEEILDELKVLRGKFHEIFPVNNGASEAFLVKLGFADEANIKSLRKPKNEIFYRG